MRRFDAVMIMGTMGLYEPMKEELNGRFALYTDVQDEFGKLRTAVWTAMEVARLQREAGVVTPVPPADNPDHPLREAVRKLAIAECAMVDAFAALSGKDKDSNSPVGNEKSPGQNPTPVEVPEGYIHLPGGRVVRYVGDVTLTADGCLAGRNAELWMCHSPHPHQCLGPTGPCVPLRVLYADRAAAVDAQRKSEASP